MDKEQHRIAYLLISLAAVVVVIAGMKATADILSPILLSLFIVMVTTPVLTWLKSKGISGWISYAVIVFSVILVGLFGIFFLATSLNQFSQQLPTYTDQIEMQLQSLFLWLDKLGVTTQDLQALDWLQPDQLVQLSFSFVSALLNVVSKTAFTLLVFIYMLASAPSFSERLRQGLQHNPAMLQRCNDFARSMSTYLLIKSWLGAITALLQIILMAIMGVDFAVLWGVISFLANFIPNFGFYIALIPPLLVALIKLGFLRSVIFAVLYAGINNIIDIVIAPRFLSKGLNLSTVVSFLAVIVWAWVLGPIGAFIALPLTILVKKLLLESFPETQLLAQLISSAEEES